MKDLFGRILTKSKYHTGPKLLVPDNDHNGTDDYQYDLTDVWHITPETPMIPQPAAFKYNLMPYQLASVYVMDRIEMFKVMTTKTKDFYTCAGILSNDMGSGKTATILGLITHRPIPAAGPPLSSYPASSLPYPVKRD